MNKNLAIIGSSAGGPRILKQVFMNLPCLNTSIILVQHMPKFVNNSMVESLNTYSQFKAKLAEDGDFLESGVIYVAPSEVHLELDNNRKIRFFQGEKVKFVCPSIDVTLLSVKKEVNGKIVGIILTGMGNDGSDGIRHIKSIGGITIAQDQETSVIFGMPNEAIKTGMVDYILSPEQIKMKMEEIVGVHKK